MRGLQVVRGADGSATLSWPVTGDDGVCGSAAAYEVLLDGRVASGTPTVAGGRGSLTLPASAVAGVTGVAVRGLDNTRAKSTPAAPVNVSRVVQVVALNGPGAVVPEAPVALLVPLVGLGLAAVLVRRRRRAQPS